jgi:hypothetical protein
MKSGTVTSSAKNESRPPESADDLDSAKSRIQELTSFWPDEFQVLTMAITRLSPPPTGVADNRGK